MGLQINESKTKHMIGTANARANRIGQNLTNGEYNIEVVKEFTYLGSLVNSQNNVKEEIRRRLVLANKCYYALRQQFTSRILTRTSKTILYKTLIIPVLKYGSEAWVLTKSDEKLIAAFERKVLRRIYGAINEDNLWRRRYNAELYELYEDSDIITKIKVSRLQWAGHVIRANEETIIKRIYTSKPEGRRKQGRPRLRWNDGVDQDARAIKVPTWRANARDRDQWRKILEEAKIQRGLSCQ